jgi:hypothetical protein
MKPVNEASASTFLVKFYDEDGNPFTPTSARWRLRNLTNKRLVQDWTTITPTTTQASITVPASLNLILNDRNTYEEQVVSIQAEPGLDGQFSDEIRYKIKNLKGFT